MTRPKRELTRSGSHRSSQVTRSASRSSIASSRDHTERRRSKQGSSKEGPEKGLSRADLILAGLENKYWQGIVGTFTVLALYGDDYRIMSFHKSADQWFYFLFFICLLIFSGELTAQCMVQEGYKWSFFFWLDSIATASLIPDIPWLFSLAVNMYGTVGTGAGADYGLARAGRAARVGTRAGRIVRLVKLVQVVRNINPADWFASPRRKAELKRLAQEAKEKEKQKRVQASRLGKILADQTTRRVIVGVLSVMVVSPFLETEFFDLAPEYGLELLFLSQSTCAGHDMYFATGRPGDSGCNSTGFTREAWEFLVYEFAHQSRGYESCPDSWGYDRCLELHAPLLWLHVPDFRNNGQVGDVESVETLRCRKAQFSHPYRKPTGAITEQKCKEGSCCWTSLASCAGAGSPEGCPWRQSEVRDVQYIPPPCKDPESSCFGLVLRAKFLIRYFREWNAFYSCQQTTFIVFLLGLGSLSFSRDTQTLVIAPIERMVNIVKQLADDPLRKPVLQNEEEDENHLVEHKRTGQLETTMLETTILKIGGLLRVGFGEAGAQIIGTSIASEEGELSIKVPGRKVIAIYGFCKVSDFVEVTDCLNEEVMVFVNKIAKIVHICCHEWSGAANKNLGDGFFLTWMLNNEDQQATMLHEGIESCPMMSELTDKALLSLIKMIAECRRASDLAAYAKHPKITVSTRFPNEFRVNLTFGLNLGWAVEGAIGSQHKIDASYISPHVNIAARLETVAKVYSTDILLSEHVARTLSQRAADRCRKIDMVKLKPAAAPLGIYCFDINRDVVTLAPEHHQMSGIIPPPEITHAELLSRGLEGYWQLDQDVVHLQEGISGELWRPFCQTWDTAFRYYASGQWHFCAEVLQKFTEDYPAYDGPTQAMSSFILSYELEPPSDWDGVRTVRIK